MTNQFWLVKTELVGLSHHNGYVPKRHAAKDDADHLRVSTAEVLLVIRILRMLVLQSRTWCRRSLARSVRPITDLAHVSALHGKAQIRFGPSETNLHFS